MAALHVRICSLGLSGTNLKTDVSLIASDALNLAMAASPPLRVLDAAGMIIGVVYVPFSFSDSLDHN